MLAVPQLLSQSLECGAPDITPAENEALLQGIISSEVETVGSATWNIPIWITYVKDDNGQSICDGSFMPLQLIDGANLYFNNGMQFYLCGISYIDSNEWYNLDPPEDLALQSFANTQNAESNKGYIDVFIVGHLVGASGYGPYPIASNHGRILLECSPFSDALANIFGHELGHFFGLLHTFQGGHVVNQSAPYLAQYVHHPTHPELYPVYLPPNGTFSCTQTGDRICDTPADPGANHCQQTGCSSPPCDVTDPQGMTYTPDKTLLMSYYSDCRNRFSDEQNQKMVSLYTGNPNWNYINDAIIPTCQALPSDVGLIRRNCQDIFTFSMPAPEFTPIEGVDVPLHDNNSQNCGVTPTTNPVGRYLTNKCVYPTYNGSGFLSILPDKNYASAPP